MTHDEYRHAYVAGRLNVKVDKRGAGRYLSRRLMLPVFVTPVIGVGAALAIIGAIWVGLAIVGVGMLIPWLVRASAPGYILTESLRDPSLYRDVVELDVLKIEAGNNRG